MAIYLFSDDYYFSLGMNKLLRKENTPLYIYKWEFWGTDYFNHNVAHGDILLLDGSNMKFVKKSVCFPLIQRLAKIFIFYDPNKGLNPLFSQWPHGSKSMSLKDLGETAARLHEHSPLQTYHPGQLTRRESEVIVSFYRGLPGDCIAQKLLLSRKTISRYKISALRKLGVRSINELLLDGNHLYSDLLVDLHCKE